MEQKESTCPKCHKTFTWDQSDYCPYCGIFLSNTCTNSDCEMNSHNSSFEDSWGFPNDYKFCPECGSKTTFHDFLQEQN